MTIKKAIIFIFLLIVGLLHIDFIFKMLRAPDDTKVWIGVAMIPLLFAYPLIYIYLNKFKLNK